MSSRDLGVPEAEKVLDAAFLTGSWASWQSSIEFTPAAGGLIHAQGDATYEMNGTANVGDFSGDVKPGGEELRFGDPKEADDCLVTVRRLGPYLLVADNLRCGGLNVSFGGLYVREPKK